MLSREEMELRLGLLEDALDQLNRTVFRQQQIDLLQDELREVYRLTAAPSAAEAEPPPDPRAEIPPHY